MEHGKCRSRRIEKYAKNRSKCEIPEAPEVEKKWFKETPAA